MLRIRINRAKIWLRTSLGGFPLLVATLLSPTVNAETAAVVASRTQAAVDRGEQPTWWTPKLPEEIRRDVENKAERLVAQLELDDEAKSRKAVALVSEHFGRVWAWHQQVDENLDAAWAAWDEARGNNKDKHKDELKALTIMTERIDPIYAEFRPQIEGFLRSLRKEIGEERTTALLDRITRSPGAKRTYNAYLGMVPEMKEAEKAILWERMIQAREDSLAAWSGKRIVKIFKKYKVRNEFSIDYFGYGYRKRYEAWAKGQR